MPRLDSILIVEIYRVKSLTVVEVIRCVDLRMSKVSVQLMKLLRRLDLDSLITTLTGSLQSYRSDIFVNL